MTMKKGTIGDALEYFDNLNVYNCDKFSVDQLIEKAIKDNKLVKLSKHSYMYGDSE